MIVFSGSKDGLLCLPKNLNIEIEMVDIQIFFFYFFQVVTMESFINSLLGAIEYG